MKLGFIGTGEITKAVVQGITKSKINYTPIKEVFGDYKEILVRFANTEKAEKLLNYTRKYNTEQVIDDIIEGFSK